MQKLSNKQKLWLIIIIATVAVILQYVCGYPLLAQILVTVIGAVVALSMFIGMIKSIRTGDYGVDLLAILAVVATLAVSEYWAAMVILVMLTGGDALEDYAAKKANTELKVLLDNTPQTAHVVKDGTTIDVGVKEVPVGAQIIVKPGEIIPLDGKVITGQSDLDESSLTGESRPVSKIPGDDVMSGSVNGSNSITIKVTKLAKDSQYQQLVKLVKTAESSPAHFVRLADHYAIPFTIVAIVIALIAWWWSGNPVRIAEVLVVASPCPLILAAPIAMVSGMSRASRNGIVVKTGTVLEKLANAKTGAFDKTGTITNGQLEVGQVIVAPNTNFTNEEVLKLAASAESESSHILARSLINYAKKQSIKLSPVKELQELTGKGITAKVNGHQLKIGKLTFVDPVGEQELLPYTAIYIAIDGQYAGAVTFVDHIRPEARRTMNELRKMGVTNLMMLTGDQASFANEVAKQVGISDVKTNLLPQGKIAALKAIPLDQHPVFMVGDGVNDAPSFVTADVGIAMGAHGATAASESASVVIIRDDLSRIAKIVEISQDTIRIAKQAVLIGIAICTILMLIACTGILPAFVGAMFQEVIDTVSILWALKARKIRLD
ncbi:heavy metal translocating P-type ATPase [Limosilactobacillus fastidiosus]|uniref:Cd(2+)-exporting ATPase n=1 Tax=Limosilactobacillus fastidiosus TaxID=2759855 RepID=A0A7W3U0D8_9LACO|nr:heavy metal translocating P-type ATPase [Limosilactobacillus fastidiosus]MBB1063779.1 cadmium-translocating P-type ATPase [Limosilactobacillus fastidiosus]MBB1086350.1 cadmium-translocating P-type ATPase [Limosilactobacillus fastidiosus]MCD7084354.1 cadmium-translocating P-type ATPase [Limosilactobacillus fastidiosus]MCD7086275.1 cadmium-translocating P-type ATPase [Limosilactobacillus fastidiosus]MCD7115038.1 cadmium-translocating P-type ATPase [Limosilactobacillus fastidiosus]